MSGVLFYGGIGIMVASLVAGAVTGLVLHTSGKRLRKQLDEEFGKKGR